MKNEIILTATDIKCNIDRLKLMAEYAKERRDFLKGNLPKLNSKKCYIRIAGRGFRAISLHNASPLCEFKKAPYTKDIKLMLDHAKNPISQVEGNPERKIQCYLIKNALANDFDLKKVLGINNAIYDELLFALDEVVLVKAPNIPKIRCDILAVGVKDAVAFPVLIELKYERQKTILNDQLNVFCDKMHDIFRDEFANLLSNCVNKKVSMSKIGKMIVWPAPDGKTSQNTMPYFKKKGIDVIEYSIVFKPVLLKGPMSIP